MEAVNDIVFKLNAALMLAMCEIYGAAFVFCHVERFIDYLQSVFCNVSDVKIILDVWALGLGRLWLDYVQCVCVC